MKTFTIEHVGAAINLNRCGKVHATRTAFDASEQIVGFWQLRDVAEKLGATHVRILGKREAI